MSEISEVPGDEQPLLQIRDLRVSFRTPSGPIAALDGVNLTLYRGQSLAIVGESGSGKSTMAHAVINLLPGTGQITGGEILFDGQDVAKLSRRELEDIRGRRIGFVPQDPMSNLNPVWSIGFQVEEAIRANGIARGRRAIRQRAVAVLQQAGLGDADRRLKQFPHQFSGGMRQRVLIGIGLAANPGLLIADEPTSALDVTVQRVVLDHLDTLTRELGTTVLFITHDLGLAAERAEQLVVMYRGKVVESGPSLEILQNPQHPYTQRLVAAAPSLASRRMRGRVPVSTGDASAVVDLVATREVREATAHEGRTGASAALIAVEHLTKVYKIRGSGSLRAVDDVSFEVRSGTTLALVGESGSGKSTVAKLVLGLETPTEGTVRVDGKDLSSLGRAGMFALRGRMQPVFQDPYGSLNPQRNIGNLIAEPLVTHRVGGRRARHQRVLELLDQVALPTSVSGRYPNELSGGQRQRVAIARALALKPEVIVLDEAVSALDVLVQAQVLRLLADLQAELGLTYLFITHDLAVVRVMADDVCVMERGRIVERASTDEVFDHPQQEYTKALLAAIPGANIELAS